MWRAGILKKDGTRKAKNFKNKEQAEEWVLQNSNNIKKSIIVNKKNIKEREITNW